MYFPYGETELAYLRRRDRRLGAVIDRVGYVDRAVDADLFSSVVHHIIGQQISTKAQATVWRRMQDALGEVNAQTVLAAGVPRLQGLGMTFRKAAYITDFAGRVQSGAFDLDAVQRMDDAYAPAIEVPRIRMVWKSIPSQLAKENKKFIYGDSAIACFSWAMRVTSCSAYMSSML